MEKKKKINKTKIVLIFWCILSVILTCISLPLYLKDKDNVHLRNFLLVSLQLLWNFEMRIIIGPFVMMCHFNPDSKYFTTTKFDKKWHSFLKIKKWVTHAPTFNPKQYDMNNLTIDQIIQNTCKNEISHDLYFLITFVPILFSIYFGNYLMTIIIALIVCQNDVLLISVQRFTRDRLKKINKRNKRKEGAVKKLN